MNNGDNCELFIFHMRLSTRDLEVEDRPTIQPLDKFYV
jgi:hypothetical protein